MPFCRRELGIAQAIEQLCADTACRVTDYDP
jgi:hypothetical protein